MYRIDLKQAQERLPELIEEALTGAEIVITREDRPLVRLVDARASERPLLRRQFGTAKGWITIADDFDEPLDDFGDHV